MGNKLLRVLSTWLFLLCAVWVQADDRAVPKDVFREHEANHFFSLPVNANSIVFIGNSITDMHEWAEAFNNPDMLNRGISGAVSDELVENLEPYITGQPKKAFLMVGTNDLAQVNKLDYTYPVRNIRKMVEHIRKVSPATEIFVQSIFPCYNTEKAPKVVRANELLREYCQETGLTYIDVWTPLAVPGQQTLRPDYTPEGLHLNAKGYAVWCKVLEPYVGATSVYPEINEISNDNGGISAAMPAGRTTVFSALPVKADDILMVGGFMTASGQWYELFKDLHIKNRGIGWGYPTGEDINMTKASIRPMLKGRADNEAPAKIFIQTGTANMNNGMSVDAAISAYQSLLDKIREYAPQTHIYVEALLPTNNRDYNVNRYAKFNEKLKTLAEGRDNTTFIDTYTPFLTASGVVSSDYFKDHIIYGKGYAKWAELLAPYISETAKPISVEETTAILNTNKLRQALGQLAINAESVKAGNDAGLYPAAAVERLQESLESAYGVLVKGLEAGETELDEQKTALRLELATAQATINMPQVSDETVTHWYNITTPLRNNFHIAAAGVGQGLTGITPMSQLDENVMWKITERRDGSFNIVSALGGIYLDPTAGQQIKAVSAEPSNGWTLKPAAQSGLYIITSGTVELNQGESSNGYKLLNWGSGTNTTDIGCQFALVPIATDGTSSAELPKPLLTLSEITLDGSAPYRVPDELAAPVLAAKTVTAVIDFTPLSTSGGTAVLTGTAAENSDAPYFGVITQPQGKAGVLYAASTENETWYVASGLDLSGRHHLVVTMQSASPAYVFNMDGTYLRNAGEADSPVLGSQAATTALFVGGLVTAGNANKYPFAGTVHSVRYYGEALTRQQIAQLSYSSFPASADALYFIRNKQTADFATHVPESAQGFADADVVLAAQAQMSAGSLFRIAGNETEGYTIRVAGDSRYYVYAINTENADSNVGVAAFDVPTAACYWKIGQQSDGWNIIPQNGSNGWAVRGVSDGISHIGQQNTNTASGNIWYIDTPATYALQHTGTGKIGDYPAFDADVVSALSEAFGADVFDQDAADKAFAGYQLLCNGNLVTPASGLYQIVNRRAQRHLFWDAGKKAITFANDGADTPKYYWTVKFAGNEAVITGSTGQLFAKSPGGYYSSITSPDVMSSVSLQRAPNADTGLAYTENYFLFPNVHLSEDKSYTINGYTAYNSDTNPYFLTTYASSGVGNQYAFEPVTFANGDAAYYVQTSGVPEGERPALTCNINGYSGNATVYDGGFFVLPVPPSADDFTATDIAGHHYRITVNGTTIHLDYALGTGIGHILPEASAADAPIYDTSGRCVPIAAKKGVYIQNGRKFLEK